MYNIVCTEPLWWVLTSKVPITLYRISLHLLINRSKNQGSFWNIYPNLIQNSVPMKFRGPINEMVANKTLCIWFDGSLIIPYWFRISIIIWPELLRARDLTVFIIPHAEIMVLVTMDLLTVCFLFVTEETSPWSRKLLSSFLPRWSSQSSTFPRGIWSRAVLLCSWSSRTKLPRIPERETFYIQISRSTLLNLL